MSIKLIYLRGKFIKMLFIKLDKFIKIYQVLEIESMEKMQQAMQDPELAKLRTDAGVDLDSQELVFLVE